MRSATIRPITSVVPPTANGTTNPISLTPDEEAQLEANLRTDAPPTVTTKFQSTMGNGPEHGAAHSGPSVFVTMKPVSEPALDCTLIL
jgi:hypothetical protein